MLGGGAHVRCLVPDLCRRDWACRSVNWPSPMQANAIGITILPSSASACSSSSKRPPCANLSRRSTNRMRPTAPSTTHRSQHSGSAPSPIAALPALEQWGPHPGREAIMSQFTTAKNSKSSSAYAWSAGRSRFSGGHRRQRRPAPGRRIVRRHPFRHEYRAAWAPTTSACCG